MTEEKQPTREEIIAFLNESIEVTKLRAELQELNTRIATGRADELKALSFIGQVLNPKQEDLENHIVTQEDVDSNPDLKENGIKAGDEIRIPGELKRKLKRETV